LDAEALEKLTTFSFEQRTKIVEEEVALENENHELTKQRKLLSRQLNEITNGATKTIRGAVLYVEKTDIPFEPTKAPMLPEWNTTA